MRLLPNRTRRLLPAMRELVVRPFWMAGTLFGILAVHAGRLAKGDWGIALLATILYTLLHEGATVIAINTLLIMQTPLTIAQLAFLDAACHAHVVYTWRMVFGRRSHNWLRRGLRGWRLRRCHWRALLHKRRYLWLTVHGAISKLAAPTPRWPHRVGNLTTLPGTTCGSCISAAYNAEISTKAHPACYSARISPNQSRVVVQDTTTAWLTSASRACFHFTVPVLNTECLWVVN
mmetsp:Transcript_31066/g.70014  ORF Transcript_31066/g.70014 Transcript_31066/m.70014 type:complete len:233 (-) Transcript_31066:273-971(-)